MASASLLFFVLMMSSLRVGKSVDSLFTLKCQPAVGVIGQTTIISCSLEARTENKPSINTVVITKFGQKNPSFTFNKFDNIVTGDTRFSFNNAPSLELHNTMISDEGEYSYFIRTSQGPASIRFTLNVTAKYFPPVITTGQKEIIDNGPADLYCTANGGYPAGTIHWFDLRNTNWTKNTNLSITQGDDGLFTLTSKLTFSKIDSLWGQYRCVVLNSRYQEEGTSTSDLKIKDAPVNPPQAPDSLVKNIVAAAVVIGSLIVGLLIVLLLKRRRFQHDHQTEDDDYEEKDALNDSASVYTKAADADLSCPQSFPH
ncbi:muscle, skeletal receptor tyrosine-protein kinase isoform X2 [Tachysurus fulvidraco]|uniref:muscle, skeletal receptor tyrosine-protein kinase isoform X2 n=1 Tax=Tachysurus fulvidraco TaxID=1234273 RepID=UPI001FEEEA8F|nr:muscle, skeletal receptor tyrosine-protein kinase isoform X2 [Tachysurus fulvidraco]